MASERQALLDYNNMETSVSAHTAQQARMRRRKVGLGIAATCLGVLVVCLCVALPLTANRRVSPGTTDTTDAVASFLAEFEQNHEVLECDDMKINYYYDNYYYYDVTNGCRDPGCSRHGDCDDPWARAQRILGSYPLVDGHNDLAYQIRNHVGNLFSKLDLTRDLKTEWPGSRTDIPRLASGRLGAQFWSCYASCSSQYNDAVRLFLDQCDVIRRFVDKYPDTFQFVDSAEGLLQAFKRGRLASMIGVEGGHSIDSSLATLRHLYSMGARYMTLTHTCDTPWADCSLADEPTSDQGSHDGLTEFGELVVKEMNRLGMFVDLAHVAKATMEDALRVSRAPVIFSHSSSWQLCHHHRNVHDDVLRMLKANGGVIMVTFVAEYVNCPPHNHSGQATLQDVADHIDYIKSVVGPDHIGIGGDYDGVDSVVLGLEDVSTYPALFVELIRRGWTDRDLIQLAGLNLVRAFQQMEQVRDSMRGLPPYDDHVPVPDLPEEALTCRKDF